MLSEIDVHSVRLRWVYNDVIRIWSNGRFLKSDVATHFSQPPPECNEMLLPYQTNSY